jgi:hypothetical protein
MKIQEDFVNNNTDMNKKLDHHHIYKWNEMVLSKAPQNNNALSLNKSFYPNWIIVLNQILLLSSQSMYEIT